MFSFFNDQSWRTLPSFGHYCVPMHTNLLKILCFSCHGKSRDIVYQRKCLILCLIFAQYIPFEMHDQLIVYSALSRLTDLGIYDISRCGIWLITFFYILYIHFQRELRKATSPKWYLSYFCSVYYSQYCIQENFGPSFIFALRLEANWIIYKVLRKNKSEWANSRLGKSVSDL